MTAGLPGAGIAGLFFIICALIMPLAELRRIASGSSTRASRRLALRQAGIAIATVTSIGAIFWIQRVEAGSDSEYRGLLGLAATALLLAAVLTTAHILRRRRNRDERRSHVPDPAGRES